MTMILQHLRDRKAIHIPNDWVVDKCHYLTIMGSLAYAVSGDNSDMDFYGFCVPPANVVFPHLKEEIPGFGRQIQKFEQWTEHHIKDPDGKPTEYDITVYNIVKYFQLCMENNPNMIDSLFTPDRCVVHMTPLGKHLRDNRLEFLHKGAWHKFKGYAYSQLEPLKKKTKSSAPKRQESIEKYGYDVKFGYHVVRLLSEVEQIMVEHDLDLERNREQLKSIRRGEWSLEQLESYFKEKESQLEEVYLDSTLKHKPDEVKIKKILMECLEIEYGSLHNLLKQENREDKLVEELKSLVRKYS